jgi:hypothetical protein
MSITHGVGVVVTESHLNRTALAVAQPQLVCAQHGHILKGVQVPSVKIEMNK